MFQMIMSYNNLCGGGMDMANKSKAHTGNYEKCPLLLEEFSEEQLARIEAILREVKTTVDEAKEAVKKGAYLSGTEDNFAMRATKKFENGNGQDKIAVTTEELQALLSCGRSTAVQIGETAEARIQIGKRVLWNVQKVREYINLISG